VFTRFSIIVSIACACSAIAVAASVGAALAGEKQVDDLSSVMQSSDQQEQRRNKMFDDIRMRNRTWFQSASPAVVQDFTQAVELRSIKHDDGACLSALNRLIAQHPEFKPAYTQRAMMLARVNRLDDSLRDCNKALAMDASDALALRHRMYCRMRMKQYAAGINDATALLKINPYDADVQRDRAQAYLMLGHKRAAQQDLKLANEHQRYSVKSTAMMAQTPEQQAALLGNLSMRLRKKPDAMDYMTRSDVLIALERFSDAMADLQAAMQLPLSEIQTAYVQMNRARCYSGMKKYDYALKAASLAIDLYSKKKGVPGNWQKSRIEEAYLVRSDLLFEQQKFDESLKDCSTYIREFPNRSVGYSKRADSLAALGHSQQAIADFEQVLKISPDNEHALVSLAQLNEKAHNPLASAKAYSQLIQLHPDISDFYLARARQYRQAGNLANALRDYNSMVSRSANDPVAYEERAQVFAQMGKVGAAKLDIDHAIKVSPEDAARLRRERAKLDGLK